MELLENITNGENTANKWANHVKFSCVTELDVYEALALYQRQVV